MTDPRNDVYPGTLSDLVIDGANRLGARPAGSGGALSFVVASVVVAVVLRHKDPRRVIPAVVLLALCCAIPGFSALYTDRADSPARAHAAAAKVTRFASDLEAFARAHRCAAVVRSTCVACDPVVRFALATTAPCDTPAPIVLHTDALDSECVEVDGALVCGAPL